MPVPVIQHAATCLEARQIRHEYPSAFRLEIDTLNVARGTTLALVGPTGAGKSTLLRLLAGVEAPAAGEIVFENQPVGPGDRSLALRRRIVLVHQRPMLLTGSVRHNVEFGLRLRGIPIERAMIDGLLERLTLSPFAEQPARSLSGGQTQLVAVARALAVSPAVLLLDEATASLDPARVAIVEEAVRSLRGEYPLTVVWSTHQLFQARRMADRVALLWDGQLVEEAPVGDFFDRPRDRRTADFVQGRIVY